MASRSRAMSLVTVTREMPMVVVFHPMGPTG